MWKWGTKWMQSICVSQFPHFHLSGNRATDHCKLKLYNYSLLPANLTMITKWFTRPYQSCAVAGQVCVSFFKLCTINDQSLGSVIHKNSSCSYIKRSYYTIVHSVVKFGCIWFLTYYYSIRNTCVFPFLVPSYHTLHSQTNTPIFPTVKMRITDKPCTLPK
jgi:hypothetical protein